MSIGRPTRTRTSTPTRPPTISTKSPSAIASASRPANSASISICRPKRSRRRGSNAGKLYPEWDYKRRAYLPDHCRVLAAPAPEHGESWAPDEAREAPDPAGAASVRGVAAAPRNAARAAGRQRTRPRRAGARALRHPRRQRRLRSPASRRAATGLRSRGDAAGRRLAVDRRLDRQSPRARRREGGAAGAGAWAVGLRRPPQHPHLHLAPPRLGAGGDREGVRRADERDASSAASAR